MYVYVCIYLCLCVHAHAYILLHIHVQTLTKWQPYYVNLIRGSTILAAAQTLVRALPRPGVTKGKGREAANGKGQSPRQNWHRVGERSDNPERLHACLTHPSVEQPFAKQTGACSVLKEANRNALFDCLPPYAYRVVSLTLHLHDPCILCSVCRAVILNNLMPSLATRCVIDTARAQAWRATLRSSTAASGQEGLP